MTRSMCTVHNAVVLSHMLRKSEGRRPSGRRGASGRWLRSPAGLLEGSQWREVPRHCQMHAHGHHA